MPAASALAAAATAVPSPHRAALALLKEEQYQVRQAVEARPALAAKLADIGAYFNMGNVLEHTWTVSTLPALDLCISKVQWLDRPPEEVAPRHLFEGIDARGLETFGFCDGTNIVEAAFGEIEKAISENGGYNEAKWQGLLLNKIGRMNERARGCRAGHYDLAQQRMANELAASYNDPLPHPHLDKLKPPEMRSTALQGVDYFHAELKRRAERADPVAAAAAAAVGAAAETEVELSMEQSQLTIEQHARSAVGLEGAGSTSAGGSASLAVAASAANAEAAAAAAAFSAPPLKRQKRVELAGIVGGMKHYGKSRATLLGCDLSQSAWRCCECPAKGRSATHNASCEHGIILAAKKAAGYNNKGKKIQ